MEKKKEEQYFEYIDIEPEIFEPEILPWVNSNQINQNISIEL